MSGGVRRALVVGGSGFLGSALASGLQRRGVDVTVFDLVAHKHLTSGEQGHRWGDIPTILGDIRDAAAVESACAGVDTVFQTAALVDWGPRSRDRLYAVNVSGNRNVIDACREQGVQRLIYTSSIDVVFDGAPIANGDESLPYPKQHLDDYGSTKAIAEQDVLTANDRDGLQTCALRTAGIYGPGDRHRMPSILDAARKRSLMRLGDGSARFGHVYIENAVHAHILAAYAMADGAPLGGEAYFIGDHPATNFFDFFEPYLRALGYRVPKRSLPEGLAMILARLMEWLSRTGLGPARPTLTRYVVASTCVDFHFSHAKAARDFGYRPVISAARARVETINDLKVQADSQSK